MTSLVQYPSADASAIKSEMQLKNKKITRSRHVLRCHKEIDRRSFVLYNESCPQSSTRTIRDTGTLHIIVTNDIKSVKAPKATHDKPKCQEQVDYILSPHRNTSRNYIVFKEWILDNMIHVDYVRYRYLIVGHVPLLENFITLLYYYLLRY